MIEVFKTDVQETEQAKELIFLLQQKFPESKINFDLDDCDKILRVEGKQICVETIIEILSTRGFECEVLHSNWRISHLN